jgi:hypothetical protein
MEGPQQRPSTSYHVAVAVLLVLILTAVTLIVSMAVRPGQQSAIAEVSTNQKPTRCHPAVPGSVCFDNVIHNAGAAAANFLCDVSSTAAGQAAFTAGTSSSTMVYLQAGNVVTVQSVVTPAGGATGVGPPLVTCADIRS